MPGKRNLNRENELRRESTKRRRVDSLLISYVKTIYPRIYDEAHMFYTSLVAIYDNKKDLTKTPEFRSFIKNKGPKMDNFELKIELIDQGTKPEMPTSTAETTSVSVAETTVVSTAETTPVSVAETTPVPPAETTVVSVAETTPVPPAETTSVPVAETTPELLPLDDDTIDQLITDLRQDPTIGDFFNNIEHELDNCPFW